MRYVTFGKTGLSVSEFGFGCIPIIRLSGDEATKVLRYAFEKGVNFYDTANAYRDSEEKIGIAFDGIRDKVIIASKTLKRNGAEALQHLENSLKMLKTDYLDLYQLHQVAQESEWQEITGPSGALEAIMKAKEAGKIKHVGVTSHSLPMAIKMVKSGLFETIQFPFNLIEEEAKEELFEECRKTETPFICMKPFGGGVIDNGEIAFKYLRDYPGVIPIPGFESIAQIDQILSFYALENKITSKDREIMEEYRLKLGRRFCRRCEYCQPCPQGVLITPAMGYLTLVSRMSPDVAVEFGKKPMESIPLCTECGACRKHCPYNLEIPETLKANYELYQKHLREKERNV